MAARKRSSGARTGSSRIVHAVFPQARFVSGGFRGRLRQSRRERAMALQKRALTPHLGAEIIGIDLTREVDEATRQAILEAWIEHGVLLFRGAPGSDDVHMRLSTIFGQMEPAATAAMNSADNPYLMNLIYDPENEDPRFNQHYNVDGNDRAGYIGWHWDQAFMPTIVRGAVLRMIEPAREAGETGFVDAIGAYYRLPQDLRDRIEGLEVTYRF